MKTSKVKPPPLSCTSKDTPWESIFVLAEKGLSQKEIGRVVGITKQAVSSRMRREEYSREGLKSFRENKADFLEQKQQLLINALTAEAIKEINPSKLCLNIAILEDKIRLNRGETTENIGVAVVDLARYKTTNIINPQNKI